MTDIRKVWIMTVPVLCTSHIPPDQIDQLEVPNSVAHDLGDDGYLIFCGEHGDTSEDGTHPQRRRAPAVAEQGHGLGTQERIQWLDAFRYGWHCCS